MRKKPCRRDRRLSFHIALLALLVQFQLAGFHLTSADAKSPPIDEIIAKFGTLVPPSAAPEIYTLMNKLVEVLAAAQENYLNDGVAEYGARSTAKFYLIDSPDSNAFVADDADETPPKKRGRHKKVRVDNHVFMTTTLLRDFLSEEPDPLSNRVIHHFAGTLAHEFTHPIDSRDAHASLVQRWGRWRTEVYPGNWRGLLEVFS